MVFDYYSSTDAGQVRNGSQHRVTVVARDDFLAVAGTDRVAYPWGYADLLTALSLSPAFKASLATFRAFLPFRTKARSNGPFVTERCLRARRSLETPASEMPLDLANLR